MTYFSESTPDIVLKSLFNKYDSDKSGSLSRDEVRTLLEKDLALSSDQVDALSMLMDKDGSSKIAYPEFRDWVRGGDRIINDQSKYYLLEKAVEMFKSYDQDQSGLLDPSEFEALMVATTGNKQLAERALLALDKDGNGKISFHEFLHWLNWLPSEDID